MINYQDDWTALMLACATGYFDVVDTLLQHKASVDIQDRVRSHHL